MGTTSNFGLPWPESSDAANVPADMEELALATEDAVLNGTGYRLHDIVYFTMDGTFDKGAYAGFKAAFVQVVGAGGGSGGVDSTGFNEAAAAAGGGGGEYRHALILDADFQSIQNSVTIGTGGSGGSSSSSGSAGGSSSFDTLITANGGDGGENSNSSSSFQIASAGDGGGGGSGGDLAIRGDDGGHGVRLRDGQRLHGGYGGGSRFAPLQKGALSGDGNTGLPYGGGAGAPAISQNTAGRGGEPGGDGIVIVYVYI